MLEIVSQRWSAFFLTVISKDWSLPGQILPRKVKNYSVNGYGLGLNIPNQIAKLLISLSLLRSKRVETYCSIPDLKLQHKALVNY